MKLYCQNPSCDFEVEDLLTAPATTFCPKCGGGHFANLKREEMLRLQRFAFPPSFISRTVVTLKSDMGSAFDPNLSFGSGGFR